MTRKERRQLDAKFKNVRFSQVNPEEAYIVNGLPDGMTPEMVLQGLQAAFKHRGGPPVDLIFKKPVGLDCVKQGEGVLMHVPGEYLSTPEEATQFQRAVEDWRTRNGLGVVLLVSQDDNITLTPAPEKAPQSEGEDA